jgi:hypothetical protein
MSRAILIDVENKTISEVEVVRNENGSQLPSIYGHLKCSTFEVVQYNEENDVYVDEEGLMYMNDDTKFFKLGNYPQPLAGNGLIMGFDDETGDNGDTKLSIEEIKNQVKFMSAFDVALSTRFGR